MYVTLSLKVPIVDVAELDRLRMEKKLNRSQYIRSALDNYNVKPTKPSFIDGPNPYKGEPRRPIPLLLKPEHIEIISLYQTKFKATKVQIIREALILEAALNGQKYEVMKTPSIDPKWEGIWVKAPIVYGTLGMHRNILYQNIKANGMESLAGVKNSRHFDKWFRLTDIIKLYRPTDDQASVLKELGGLTKEAIQVHVSIATSSIPQLEELIKSGTVTEAYIAELVKLSLLTQADVDKLIKVGILTNPQIMNFIKEGKLLDQVNHLLELGIILEGQIADYIQEGVFTQSQLEILAKNWCPT